MLVPLGKVASAASKKKSVLEVAFAEIERGGVEAMVATAKKLAAYPDPNITSALCAIASRLSKIRGYQNAALDAYIAAADHERIEPNSKHQGVSGLLWLAEKLNTDEAKVAVYSHAARRSFPGSTFEAQAVSNLSQAMLRAYAPLQRCDKYRDLMLTAVAGSLLSETMQTAYFDTSRNAMPLAVFCDKVQSVFGLPKASAQIKARCLHEVYTSLMPSNGAAHIPGYVFLIKELDDRDVRKTELARHILDTPDLLLSEPGALSEAAGQVLLFASVRLACDPDYKTRAAEVFFSMAESMPAPEARASLFLAGATQAPAQSKLATAALRGFAKSMRQIDDAAVRFRLYVLGAEKAPAQSLLSNMCGLDVDKQRRAVLAPPTADEARIFVRRLNALTFS